MKSHVLALGWVTDSQIATGIVFSTILSAGDVTAIRNERCLTNRWQPIDLHTERAFAFQINMENRTNSSCWGNWPSASSGLSFGSLSFVEVLEEASKAVNEQRGSKSLRGRLKEFLWSHWASFPLKLRPLTAEDKCMFLHYASLQWRHVPPISPPSAWWRPVSSFKLRLGDTAVPRQP